MGWMEFVSSLVSSLAWPFAVVIVVLLLRTKISELLAGGLRRLKAGPVELEWDRVAGEVARATGLTHLEESTKETPPLPPVRGRFRLRSELDRLAQDRPKDAVLAGYAAVEAELRRLLAERVPEASKAPDLVSLAGIAAARQLLDRSTLESVEGLHLLRNLAVHSRASEMSPGKAMEYLDMADGVLFALGHRLSSSSD